MPIYKNYLAPNIDLRSDRNLDICKVPEYSANRIDLRPIREVGEVSQKQAPPPSAYTCQRHKKVESNMISVIINAREYIDFCNKNKIFIPKIYDLNSVINFLEYRTKKHQPIEQKISSNLIDLNNLKAKIQVTQKLHKNLNTSYEILPEFLVWCYKVGKNPKQEHNQKLFDVIKQRRDKIRGFEITKAPRKQGVSSLKPALYI